MRPEQKKAILELMRREESIDHLLPRSETLLRVDYPRDKDVLDVAYELARVDLGDEMFHVLKDVINVVVDERYWSIPSLAIKLGISEALMYRYLRVLLDRGYCVRSERNSFVNSDGKFIRSYLYRFSATRQISVDKFKKFIDIASNASVDFRPKRNPKEDALDRFLNDYSSPQMSFA